MSQSAYVVSEISCSHCTIAVTEEVTKVRGVTGVEVDLDTKLVRVSGDGFAGEDVIAAIDEAGYDARVAA
jgi:copper chaperone